MKAYALINFGLEKTALQEFSQKYSIKAEGHSNLILFDATVQQLITIAHTAQSIKKLCVFIGNSLTEFPEFNWGDYWQGNTFKIEVNNVKGQENRLSLARTLLEKLKPFFLHFITIRCTNSSSKRNKFKLLSKKLVR